MVDIKRAFMFPTPWRAQGTCAATYMYPRALRKEHNIHSILIHDALSMGQRGPDRAHGLKDFLWLLHLHNWLFFTTIRAHAQIIYLSWQSCKNPFRIVFYTTKWLGFFRVLVWEPYEHPRPFHRSLWIYNTILVFFGRVLGFLWNSRKNTFLFF